MLETILPHLFKNLDLYIAVGLLLTVIVVYIVSRIGVLPSRSPLVVAAAVLGALGMGWLAMWRRKVTTAQIEELKKRIADRETAINQVIADRDRADEELAAARAALDNQVAAAKVELAEIDRKLDEELGQIGAATPDETAAGFARQLRERKAAKERALLAAQAGGTP